MNIKMRDGPHLPMYTAQETEEILDYQQAGKIGVLAGCTYSAPDVVDGPSTVYLGLKQTQALTYGW